MRSLKSFRNLAHVKTLSTFVAPVTALTQLDNCVRVLTETSSGDTATVGVWVGAGSRNENAQQSGSAQLLKQMAVKDKSNDIKSLGNNFSAATCFEHTFYSAQVLREDIPHAMQLLADVIQNSTVESDIECETRKMLAENTVRSNCEIVEANLHETAYLQANIAKVSQGTGNNSNELSPSELKKFQETHYTADRLVIAGTGAVDHSQLVDLSEKYFSKLIAAKSTEQMETALYTGSDKRVRYDSMPTAHVAVAFQGACSSSEYVFPMMVMEKILGCWENTTFFTKNISSTMSVGFSETNLMYSYRAFYKDYKDSGLFGIYFTAPDCNLEESMHNIMLNITRLSHDVTEEEVEFAKKSLKSSICMELMSSSNTCCNMGEQILAYDRRISLAEMEARINNVTVLDVKKTANKFLNDEDHVLAALGPIYELPDYNWVRARTYWKRY